MWPAFVIALLSGLSIGYWIGLRRGATTELRNLQQENTTMQSELEQAHSTQKLLEQESADLRYQLGEEKKARVYAEQRYAKKDNE
ncbi:MAG: uncharacterized membrane-anchored protein YhcB (DUF1043 family) [Oceanicoccus sp.]|jgi:uncharacterized membrane-anchored protein YhcB (DUF1043 family)